MKPLAFSPAAEADIEGIWDYSAADQAPPLVAVLGP